MNINLKDIRKKLNFSQQEFAEKLNVTQTLISKIEANKSKPTLRMLSDISEKFNINLMYLISGEGEMFISEQGSTNLLDKVEEPEGTYQTKNEKLLTLIEQLTKSVEEKDSQIDDLLKKSDQLFKSLEEKNAQIDTLLKTIDRLTLFLERK